MNHRKLDNIFPLTKEEILENFQHVFNNAFQARTIEQDSVWNLWTDEDWRNWFSEGYTKGHSTAAILINAQGEKDYVVFWKYYRDGRVQHGYSFQKREMFNTILN
jgi:hypothetical protein